MYTFLTIASWFFLFLSGVRLWGVGKGLYKHRNFAGLKEEYWGNHAYDVLKAPLSVFMLCVSWIISTFI